MQLCLPVTRKMVQRASARSLSASSAAAPTFAPTSRTPAVSEPKKYTRTPDDKRLMNHSGKDSVVCCAIVFVVVKAKGSSVLRNV